MTCIVGIVEDGNVLIGADSLSSSHHSKSVVANPKILYRQRPSTGYPSDVLMGYTGSWRMGQLLRTLQLPKMASSRQDPFDWLSTAFVDEVRDQLKAGGYATSKDGQEVGGEFLIAFAGRLFKMQSDYSVLENTCGYDAAGSGEAWALGSLHATATMSALTSEWRLRMALSAAEDFNPSVAAPFHIASLADRGLRAVA